MQQFKYSLHYLKSPTKITTKKLSNNKLPGTDRLSYKFYKQFAPFLLHNLTTLLIKFYLKTPFSVSGKLPTLCSFQRKERQSSYTKLETHHSFKY
jgi:hypothetical protein